MIRARWRRVMVAFGDRTARVKYVLLCDVEPGQSYGCQPKIWKCACWFGLHRRWMHDGERVSPTINRVKVCTGRLPERGRECPLYPRKRTFDSRCGMSASCP